MIAVTTKFNFKSRAIKDESGNTIGRTKKQDSLEVALPLPEAGELAGILLESPDSAVAKLILAAVSDVIINGARMQFDEVIESFGDDASKDLTAGVLDYDKLTLDFIASIPPTQRGMTAITEEEYTAFYADYLSTMIAATGKTEQRIKNGLALIQKPQKAKANKEVLAVMIDQLNIYLAASGNVEEHAACADRVLTKFKAWVAAPEVVANLDLL
jgi:hypothetical protein